MGEPVSHIIQDLVEQDVLAVVRVELLLVLSTLCRTHNPAVGPATQGKRDNLPYFKSWKEKDKKKLVNSWRIAPPPPHAHVQNVSMASRWDFFIVKNKHLFFLECVCCTHTQD
jgi:hypothetical protein